VDSKDERGRVGLIVPVSAAASTSLNLRGVGMGGFSQPVMLLGGSGHMLSGNQLGGIANGVALPGAALNAISVGINAGGRLIVGGPNVSDRNVISDANFAGVFIQPDVQLAARRATRLMTSVMWISARISCKTFRCRLACFTPPPGASIARQY
jgi:hypothetical protein